jgi:hypothetical protein
MDGALEALAAWLLASIFLGLAGGFKLIRRVESSNGQLPKTWLYWTTLIVLYPVILMRAAIWAMWEIMIGGAR